MTSKNSAIREDVYRRLFEGRSELMSFAGIMSDDEEFESAMKDVAEDRFRRTIPRPSSPL